LLSYGPISGRTSSLRNYTRLSRKLNSSNFIGMKNMKINLKKR
jgi:hypothetical protein